MRLVFELGHPKGGVVLEVSDALAPDVWHHAAVSWEPSATDASVGTARIHVDGHLVAKGEKRPAPLLDGSTLKLGYVDFGVGALKFECAEAAYSDRVLTLAEIKTAAQAHPLLRDRKPQPVDPLFQQVVTRAFDLLKQNEKRTATAAPATSERAIVLAPEKDRSFATALRAALGRIERGEAGTKTIALKPGTYFLGETIELTGAAFDGLALVAADGAPDAVTISGGKTLARAAFTKPSAAAGARFPAAVRDKIVCVKIPLPDALTPYGYGEQVHRGVLLFANGGTRMLTPARWPKGTAYPPLESVNGTFRFKDPAAPKIAAGTTFLMHGYWKYFWADVALPVEVRADGTFKLPKEPGAGLGNEPIAAMVGVPEALTEPGEWCYADGTLYLYPPDDLSSVTLPLAQAPFLRFHEVADVRLSGLAFTDAAGTAVEMDKMRGLRIENCRFRRLGGEAAHLWNCPRTTIVDCTFADFGHAAVWLSAGDRPTLTPGDALVERCTFARTGHLQRTYTPGILLEGFGNAVRNCRFSDLPSSGLRIEGNDHIVRDCTFERTVRESDDQGSIDMFGNPTYRGCVFFHNRFQDIGGGGLNACGRAGIRLDDMISGMAVVSNSFIRSSEGHFGAVQIHAGHYNAVVGNTFSVGGRGVTVQRWGSALWRERISSEGMRSVRLYMEGNPEYRKRYPEYERLLEDHARQLIIDNEYVEP